MNRTRLLVLMVLTGAAAGAFFLLNRGGPSFIQKPLGVGSEAAVPTFGGTGDTSPAPVEKGTRARPLVTSPFRPQASHVKPAPLTILVQDQQGLPVAGAAVSLLRSQAHEPSQDQLVPALKVARFQTNSRGAAVVQQLPKSAFRVAAKKGGEMGFANIQPHDLALPASQIVKLLPIKLVEISVQDREGRPLADVRVAAGQYGFSADGPSAWTRAPDGLARLEVTPLSWIIFNNKTLRPLARLASGEVVHGAKVPWAKTGVTRAHLEVERGVTLELLVTDQAGRPALGQHTLKWRPASEAKKEIPEGLMILGLADPSLLRSRRFAGARTRVVGFQPGAHVELTLLERGRSPRRKLVQMPSLDELFKVSLVQGPQAARLEIPVLDGEGKPVIGQPFEVKLELGRASTSDSSRLRAFIMLPGQTNPKDLMVTDKHGILSRFVEVGRAGSLRVRPASRPLSSLNFNFFSGKTPFQTRRFPALAPGQVQRLEPLVLKSTRLVVAGRIVDGEGKGQQGIPVRVVSEKPGRDSQGSQLVKKSGLEARSGENGVFEITSDKPQKGGLLFAFQGTQALSELVPFSLGQRALQVPLQRAGSLRGVLKTRAAAPPQGNGTVLKNLILTEITGLKLSEAWVRVQLDPLSGAALGPGRCKNPFLALSANVKKDGSFFFKALPAGSYDASVLVDGFRVLKVHGIQIVSGAETRDPRLDGVSVGEEMQRVVVKVTAPGGAPVPGAEVVLRFVAAEAGKSKARSNTNSQGLATFRIPRGLRVGVRVVGRGFRPWQASAVSFPLQVVLDPGCRLTVRVGGVEALDTKQGGRSYALELAIPSSQQIPPNTASTPHSQDLKPSKGKVIFKGLGPFTYELFLRAYTQVSFKSAGFSMSSRSPAGKVKLGVITIREGEPVREATFQLTPEQIATLNGS